MSAPRCVCDVSFVMRTRLLFGLYCRRAVPPRWRPLAVAYCLTVAVVTLSYLYYSKRFWTTPSLLLITPSYGLYYLSIFTSLYTGDDYIYKFFEHNEFTDITLDSPRIFNRLQNRIRLTHAAVLLFYFAYMCLHIAVYYNIPFVLFVIFIPSVVFDVLLVCSFASKLLVMALFDARLLVLKRRLQRYGFRTVGRARPQPYSEIYNKIIQGLDATDNPLKLLLFFDLICNCSKIIGTTAYYIYSVQWKNYEDIQLFGRMAIGVICTVSLIAFCFGHVMLLETAAEHCQDMAVFTATQLIKNPTAAERLRMRSFLSALEGRGARYSAVRALPLDASEVLRVLGFCSSQIILIVNATQYTNH